MSANLKPFRFWCQKVLPLVYDESLSYYELLCKVVYYINNMIVDINNMENEINELKTYVDNYFSNLDVQDEINKKLDEMVENGTLSNIFQNTFAFSVTYYGAKGDGITDDTEAIKTAFSMAESNNGCIIFESGKKYLVSSLNIDTSSRLCVLGNNSELLCNDSNGISIRCGQNSCFYSLIFNGNNKATTTFTSKCPESIFENCLFENGVTTNLILESEYYGQKLCGCVIGNNLSYIPQGIIINATDCALINSIVINSTEHGIQINGNETYLNTIHVWCNKPSTGGNTAFIFNAICHCNQIYSDTYQISFRFNIDTRNIIIENSTCVFYAIDDIYNTYCIYVNDPSFKLKNVSINNCVFTGKQTDVETTNFANVRLYNLLYKRANNFINNNFNDINKLNLNKLVSANNSNININDLNVYVEGYMLYIVGVLRHNGVKFTTSQLVLNINTSAIQIYGDQYFKDVYGSSTNDYAYMTSLGVIGVFQNSESDTFKLNLAIPLREKFLL